MEEDQQQNDSKDAENIEVPTEENRIECVHCGGTYSSKDSLRSHKRISHGILANGKRKTDSFDESEAKKPKSETKKIKKVTPTNTDSQR